ncbi:hypothetical protein [Bradyrhizobium sp.]|uniref:hypothetical protein n=1 Tax=Bradyrhizobium sp. TaxID=376 RepID=UPI0039E5E8E4
MSLDLFDPQPALQNAQSNLAHDLPAEFLEAFDVSTRVMTEWNSSVNYANARDHALASFYDNVKARTGIQLPLYGMGGNVSLDELNDAIAKLPQDPNQPEPSYRPLSEGDIDSMALTRMRRAHDDAAAFGRRETTWGGTMGTITGTLAAGVSDPIAIATLPLGGAGQAGIALRALEFALIGGGTEAAIVGAGGPSRERAAPGSLRKEAPSEIASAVLFGGAFGAGLGGLQKLIGTGARPLPVTVRDEVNAAASEGQLNLSNPFPGAAADAAHRDAVVSSVRAAIDGRPVKAGDEFFEAWHGSPHDFDRFDVSKIGTGEGNQAYGRGLYFAENEDVARGYQRSLAERDQLVADLVEQSGGNWEKAHAAFKSDIEGRRRLAESVGGSYEPTAAEQATLSRLEAGQFGNLYKVKINANRDNFLDLDKPLSEQSEFVRNALLGHSDPGVAGTAEKWGHDVQNMMRRIGYRAGPKELNETIEREAAVARVLSEAGIPGVKYFDAGSRDAGAGSRNYVVFDDKHVAITHKNGKPLTIAEARAADYASAAKSQTPEEFALAGEKHLRPETFDQVPDVEHFERMPAETDDAASYWDARLEAASPEEKAALGATDGQETITSAAIRYDGHVFEGALHSDAYEAAASATGRDFGEVISATKPQDSGFLTSSGRFVDREEAARIANGARQTTHQVDELVGEHLPDGYFQPTRKRLPTQDLSPEQTAALEADPVTAANTIHDLDHYVEANPDAEFATQVRMPDGSYQFTTQKLSDVIKELDEFERAGKEIEACVVGLEAAE